MVRGRPVESDQKESFGRTLIKGSSVTFIGLLIIALAHFGLKNVFLPRALSKTDFGLLYAIIAFVSTFNILSHLGLNRSITKFVSKFKASDNLDKVKDSIISSLVPITLVSITITGIFIALSGYLSISYFQNPEAKLVLIIFSIWFTAMSYHNFFTSVFQGLKDFLGRSLARIVRNLTPVIGIVVFSLFYNLEIIDAALFFLLGPIFSTALLLIILGKRHSNLFVDISGKFSKPLLKKMFIFGLPLILSGVASTIMGKTDRLMLMGLRSAEDVGNYEIARMSKTTLMYLGTALSVPLFPMISELWENEEFERLRRILGLISKYSLIMVIPGALVFVAFPHTIIRTLPGTEYLPAVNALRILSVSTIFLVVGRVFVASLTGIGKTTLVLKSTAVAAAFNVGANILLIPEFGSTGAALATGMSFVVAFALGLYYSRREIGFSFPMTQLGKVGTGGILTLGIIFALKNILHLPTWPELFLVLAVSGIFYLLWIFGTKTMIERDLDIIKDSVAIPDKVDSLLRKLCRE